MTSRVEGDAASYLPRRGEMEIGIIPEVMAAKLPGIIKIITEGSDSSDSLSMFFSIQPLYKKTPKNYPDPP